MRVGRVTELLPGRQVGREMIYDAGILIHLVQSIRQICVVQRIKETALQLTKKSNDFRNVACS